MTPYHYNTTQLTIAVKVNFAEDAPKVLRRRARAHATQHGLQVVERDGAVGVAVVVAELGAEAEQLFARKVGARVAEHRERGGGGW